MHHALSVGVSRQLNSWIVDSGTTYHICNNGKLFVKAHSLKQALQVTLEDGPTLEVTGYGIIELERKLPD